MRKTAIVAAALALSFAVVETAAGQTYNLTVAGGSARGILTTLNSGIDAAVAAQFPGSTITYQTSGGGFANIALVDRKKVPLGYVVDAEIRMALEGSKPFKRKYDSIRTIAYVIGWVPMHLVVTRSFADKYGLKTFADIAKKKPPIRMALQQRGNVVSTISEIMLKEIGVTVDDIRSWGGQVVYVGGSEQGPLMANRRSDMMFNMTAVKGRVATAVERARDVVMLTVDKDLIDRVAARTGLTTFTIPAAAYKWMDRDMYTLSLGISLIAHKDLDDPTAYNLAKAITEKIDKIRAVHPFLRKLTKEYLVSLEVGEYHPGAIKYYKEAGLMK
jgi:uncharacterized protein